MGGNADKTGIVKKEKLEAVFRFYSLSIDLEVQTFLLNHRTQTKGVFSSSRYR